MISQKFKFFKSNQILLRNLSFVSDSAKVSPSGTSCQDSFNEDKLASRIDLSFAAMSNPRQPELFQDK
ncbi:hypothetical protein EV13_2873 [Prochlorococcus sp. MIT 0702]|nr:hypothetical protein EV12_2820 [Prochlorococcus sp. MIT 0701]KGG26094.1 hypothetical protein EV13_2873 [Prochlorococcus sp. MIT 0702]KGG30731.1 hypothetical protein EV14_2664 [Prochlorococcus sp. MIT 0703]